MNNSNVSLHHQINWQQRQINNEIKLRNTNKLRNTERL